MKLVYVFILFNVLYNITASWYDVKFEKEGKPPHWITALNMSWIIGYMSLSSFFNFGLMRDSNIYVEILETAFCMITFRYILFDGFYNLWRKQPWSTPGTTWFLDKLPQPWRLSIKCLMGFFTIIFLMQWLWR